MIEDYFENNERVQLNMGHRLNVIGLCENGRSAGI